VWYGVSPVSTLRWLQTLVFGPPGPPMLEEQRFPHDARGAPDLSYFTRPVTQYVAYIDEYLAALEPKASGVVIPPEQRTGEWQAHRYRKGVIGSWGLIARGPGEALPYVLSLLDHAIPEAREMGAGVLDAWVTSDQRVDVSCHVLAAAEREASAPDGVRPEPLGMLLLLLARLKVSEALPLMARVLRAPESRNGDVDWLAAEAIMKFSGERVARKAELRDAANRWLQARGL